MASQCVAYCEGFTSWHDAMIPSPIAKSHERSVGEPLNEPDSAGKNTSRRQSGLENG
ncbi:hypothetical protein MCA2697 [Methylococcus capsulatus str. Bath]|uniref:Uncharacterized protein n=2 Tax=Methylococcus capsulatus TaxID=414 RepID=Q603V0_METCA|nr:hypothetical protein MCA2697 [Methylococcus capsulatus str. Bath]